MARTSSRAKKSRVGDYVIAVIVLILFGALLLFYHGSGTQTQQPSPITAPQINPTSVQQTTPTNNTNSTSNSTTNNTELGGSSCPLLFYQLNGSVISYSGAFEAYNLTSSYGQNFTDYVASMDDITNSSNSSIYAQENVSDLLSEPTPQVFDREHYVILMPINSTNSSAENLNYTVQPTNYTLSNNATLNVTLTINSATENGTYWTIIDGPCGGGVKPFLLTIGNGPYNGTFSSPLGVYS